MCHPLWFPAATTAQLGPLRKRKKPRSIVAKARSDCRTIGFLRLSTATSAPIRHPRAHVRRRPPGRLESALPLGSKRRNHSPPRDWASAPDRLAPHTSLRSRPLSHHSIGQIVPTFRTRRALIPYRRYHSIVPGIVRRCQARGTTQVFTRSGVRNLVAPIDNRSVTSYDAANVLMNDAC